MKHALHALNINMAYMSIDDFYLTRADQEQLGNENKYLSGRGVAGTHDIDLGAYIIRQLKYMSSDDVCMNVPIYDKTAHNGLGDRSAEVRTEYGPVDLVLFEGWMLGYQPLNEQDEASLEAKYNGMGLVNQKLKGYK